MRLHLVKQDLKHEKTPIFEVVDLLFPIFNMFVEFPPRILAVEICSSTEMCHFKPKGINYLVAISGKNCTKNRLIMACKIMKTWTNVNLKIKGWKLTPVCSPNQHSQHCPKNDMISRLVSIWFWHLNTDIHKKGKHLHVDCPIQLRQNKTYYVNEQQTDSSNIHLHLPEIKIATHWASTSHLSTKWGFSKNH